MKLSNIRRHILRNCKAVIALAAMVLPLAACEKIYEGEGDCRRFYQVAITQTRNMLGKDAFPDRVNSVSLYVFDQNGKLVTVKSESGEALKTENYLVKFDDGEIEPGIYDLVVWGGMEGNSSFELIGSNPLTKNDFVCRLNREYNGTQAFSDKELQPVFHGFADNVVFPEFEYGVIDVATVDLMKDTNTVYIVINQKNGRQLNVDHFNFSISDKNGLMNHDNTLLDDENIIYNHYTKRNGTLTEEERNSKSRAYETGINSSVMGALSLSRLHNDTKPTLSVTYQDHNDPVLDISLMKLLDAARDGSGEQLPLQEYLDREHVYILEFTIDDDNKWYSPGGIFVNGWKVVLQDSNM